MQEVMLKVVEKKLRKILMREEILITINQDKVEMLDQKVMVREMKKATQELKIMMVETQRELEMMDKRKDKDMFQYSLMLIIMSQLFNLNYNQTMDKTLVRTTTNLVQLNHK